MVSRAPPPKKRKTIDLTGSSPPRPPSRSTRRASSSSSTNTTSAAAASTGRPSHSLTNSPSRHRSLSTRSSNGITKPPTSKPKPPTNPKSSSTRATTKKPSSRKTATGKHSTAEAFSSLFGTQFSYPSSSQADAHAAPNGSQHSNASVNEDADDLIEVSSEDEPPRGLRSFGRPTQSTVVPPAAAAGNASASATAAGAASQIMVSKPGARLGLKSLLSTKRVDTGAGRPGAVGMGTTKQSDSARGSKGPTTSDSTSDPRPWPERYAPKTTADLAVHKAKVEAVRSWLARALSGSSRQRMLVLNGPAGTGKTATVEALSKEMGFEILEWRNPQNAPIGLEYGEEGAFSAGLSGLFEEFLSRAGKFNSLELVSSTSGQPPPQPMPTPASTADASSGRKKIILIEDFPNTLFTTSSHPLQSFRLAIKSYLASPSSSTPLPPLVLIVSETASVTGPDSFTAHRLLSPELLHHARASQVSFNRIAKTFMIKALSAVLTQDAALTNRRVFPSKPVLTALSSSGDIRSAIMGLEFLAVNAEASGAFTQRVHAGRGRGRKTAEAEEMTDAEKAMLDAVTHREHSLDIFHAVGKVVYNKRYGDDVDDPYVPPPPRPPLESHPYHRRAMRTDPSTLLDTAGTDASTFVSALHENYLGSCNLLGGPPPPPLAADSTALDLANNVLDALSDADLLSSLAPYGRFDHTDPSAARADEMGFHVAVRGTTLALPSPVKRSNGAGSGSGGGGSGGGGFAGNKLYYPVSARLWRARQEMEETLDWLVAKTSACTSTFTSTSSSSTFAATTSSFGRTQAVVERLPYLSLIERAKQQQQQHNAAKRALFTTPTPSSSRTNAQPSRIGRETKSALDKLTVFSGVGRRSEDAPTEDEGESGEDAEAGNEREVLADSEGDGEAGGRRWRNARWQKGERSRARVRFQTLPAQGDGSEREGEEAEAEKWVLSDDDIEDF